MRQVTATEKYRAVNEGKMAKKEFVRQMRQAFPNLISQYDGFDSSVQILKNRGMIFEAAKSSYKEEKAYDEKQAATVPLDALDRGTRIELEAMGVDVLNPAKMAVDDYKKAYNKALANLKKDPNHYINLMAGESSKVDKHDKETEVKRGAAAVDTFNGMKKANLKEGMHIDDEEWEAEMGRSPEDTEKAIDREASKIKNETEMSEDAKKNLLGKVVGVLRAKYPDITAGILRDFIRTHYQDLLDGVDIETEFKEYIDNNYEGPSDMREAEEGIDMSSKDGYIAFIDNENILANYTPEDAEEMARELAMTHHDAGEDQDNFVKSFMAAYKEGGYDYDDQVHEKTDQNKDGKNDFKDVQIARMKASGMSHDDAVKKITGKSKDESYAMKRMQKAHTQDRLAGKKSTYDQAKEKDKDQEKQLKEAIKSIIKKTLINEAATVKLADWAESYESFPGVKPVVNELENIVTEIETFYDKMSDKIAKVFEKTAGFENEEGLKIGGFIAPSLESAFGQDLSKVIKKGSFFSKINLPKVRTITQADVDAHNSGDKPLGETEIVEEPKSTVFTPNF